MLFPKPQKGNGVNRKDLKMNEIENPIRILLATITLFGGMMLSIVFPNILIFGSTVGAFWVLFPRTLLI